MSRFCPFCDDVRDSELDTVQKFKEHLFECHRNQILNGGSPVDVDSEAGVIDVEER